MKRSSRTAALVALALLAPAASARAARLVLMPVVVGSSPEPARDLLDALARGLQEGGSWTVVTGPGLKAALDMPPGLAEQDRARLQGRLDEAVQKMAPDKMADAVTALEALRRDVAEIAKNAAFAPADFDLEYRIDGTLVAALASSAQRDKAKLVADETAMLFPGRKPTDADKLPAPAPELLNAATPAGGIKLTLKSVPDGCDLQVNGRPAGRAPVDVSGAPAGVYQVQAQCGELRSFPRRIVLGTKETAREEVIDAELERTLQAEGGARVRFANAVERRQIEDTLAKKIAERYQADLLVFASVGELSGADWLNARLYLRSGYLNRQALVRQEPARAVSLGRYLATGRDMPGVLKPEEAGALVAAGNSVPEGPKQDPWYTDYVGWTFAGVGLVGVGIGYWQNKEANRAQDEGDMVRGDSERQQSLYRESQRHRFIANIGLIGGGLMTLTGVVLLAIPEYRTTSSEVFVMAPPSGAGMTFGLRGRF
jgi:hypothetical protein